MKRFSSAFVLALAFSTVALATDLPYGADGLPYLDRKASVVVKVKSATSRHSPVDGILWYTAIIETSLKGKIGKVDHIDILLQDFHSKRREPGGFKELGKPKEPSLTGAIVFLYGPLNAEDLEDLNLKKSPKFVAPYGVVSGRLGIIDHDPERSFRTGVDRQAAVKTFVEMQAAKRIDWSAKYLESKDAFLQKSALLQLDEDVRRQPGPSIDLLKKAIQSKLVIPANVIVAINGLGNANNDAALAPLEEFATNPKNSNQMRGYAVQAVANLPGGRNLLKKWKDGGDKFLSPKAEELLNKLSIVHTNMLTASEDALLKGLSSTDRNRRREAVMEIARIKASDKVIGALLQIAKSKKEDNSVKLMAVETMGNWKMPKAAEALASIAMDKEQLSIVRRSAVLAISRMECKIGNEVLRRLAKDLEDSEVKTLAAGLASCE